MKQYFSYVLLQHCRCIANCLLTTVLNRIICAGCQIEIRCTKVGEWTAEFTMCSKLQGSCSPPPNLNSVEYSCDQGRDVGESNLEGQACYVLNTQCWLHCLLPVKWNKSINSSLLGLWLIWLRPVQRSRTEVVVGIRLSACFLPVTHGAKHQSLRLTLCFKSNLKTYLTCCAFHSSPHFFVLSCLFVLFILWSTLGFWLLRLLYESYWI